MTSRTGLPLLFALLLASWPVRADAQSQKSVSITPVQSLSFGLLVPGIRGTVRITDVSRRAVVALAGKGPVDITLVLPSSLDSPTGERIPLQFSTGDAAFLNADGSTISTLDPLQANRVTLRNDRTILFVLGGTAVTTATTRPGHYTARVTLLVNQPGT